MENWKQIQGYEGHYEISDLGRVRSIQRIAWNGFKNHILKGRILKIGTFTNGYKNVCLCKNGIVKRFLLHRLVASHFIDNPYNLPEVNHEFGDKSDNRACVLSWMDKSQNNKHAFRIGLRVGKSASGKDHSSSKEIFQYDLNGNLLKKWHSSGDIKRVIKLDSSFIREVARGEKKTAYGFIWKYN